MVTPTAPDDRNNIQVATGTSPLYICAFCSYTPVSYAKGQCLTCQKGLPRPDLSFIKDLSERRISLDQLVSGR